jgi:predicted Co/Zn/Cd cation transporter (cation efflux family)
MKIRVYVLSLLALAMASFLLLHFGLIWAYGKFYIYESNPIVLILETTLIVAILAFSFYCFMEQLRETKEDHEKAGRVREVYYPKRGRGGHF